MLAINEFDPSKARPRKVISEPNTSGPTGSRQIFCLFFGVAPEG